MALLNKDDEMIQRMEVDLASKASEAFVAADVNALVHGVFSLDDLEDKLESQLQRKVGIGVAYSGCAPVEIDFNPRSSAAPGQGTAARMLAYRFLVVLAVPTEKGCLERYNGTKLLTVLRNRIHGSTVDGDAVARRWNFQKEEPNVGASTETMLYYSQVWQVALPVVGPSTN